RSLGPVLGVDGNVFVREVAGPHRGRGLAAVEHDAHSDLALRHRALAVFLAVRGRAPSGIRDLHVVQVQLDAADVESAHARVADRGEQPPEVRVRGEERGLYERGVRYGVGDARALGLAAALLDPHGDELRRALSVAHDRL